MTALVWRLHRGQAGVTALTFAALLAVLLPTGLHMAGTYHAALAACAGSGSCSALGDTLFQGDGLVIDLVLATVAVPALLGMFIGAPVVAKEDEDGTLPLAWTQTVTRRRWFLVTAAWLLLAAVAVGAAASLLVGWWARPETALHGRINPGSFDVQGIVPIAYAVFAVSLGLVVGSWIRRPLPAAALTLAVFTAIRVVVLEYLRPHLLAPLQFTHPLTAGLPPASASWWRVSHDLVNAAGVPIQQPAQCTTATPANLVDCLVAHGYHWVDTYQPASRFWAFQGIESALFLVLAATCLAAAYLLAVRRDA